MHVQNIGTQKKFAQNVLRTFLHWNRENVKEVSMLGQRKLFYIAKNMYNIWVPAAFNYTGQHTFFIWNLNTRFFYKKEVCKKMRLKSSKS